MPSSSSILLRCPSRRSYYGWFLRSKSAVLVQKDRLDRLQGGLFSRVQILTAKINLRTYAGSQLLYVQFEYNQFQEVFKASSNFNNFRSNENWFFYVWFFWWRIANKFYFFKIHLIRWNIPARTGRFIFCRNLLGSFFSYFSVIQILRTSKKDGIQRMNIFQTYHYRKKMVSNL